MLVCRQARRRTFSRQVGARASASLVWLLLVTSAFAVNKSSEETASGGWFPKEALVRVSLQTESSGVIVDNQYIAEARVSEVAEFDGVRLGDEGHVVSLIGDYATHLDLETVRITLRTLRGRSFPARALGVDERLSLLFIKDESPQPMPGLRISQEMETTRFNVARIINGRLQLASPCVRSRDAETRSPFQHLVVTDLTPTPAGWRGATSVDLHGKWLGIITEDTRHKASRKLANCRLLTASVITKSLDTVKSGTERIRAGWLGVFLEQRGKETWVNGIEEGSPAEQAGLRPGDVIVQVDGREFGGLAELAAAIRLKGPGGKSLLKIQRDQSWHEVTAVLGAKRPHGQTSWKMELSEQPTRQTSGEAARGGLQVYRTRLPALLAVGLQVSSLGGPLAGKLQSPTGAGLLVKEVVSGSRAEKAGLLTGDLIFEVNGKAVKSIWDVEQDLRGVHGEALELRFVRDGQRLYKKISLQ